ncbi:glycosyltransferase [Candidatus Micrarchaeota archaeon]|nr:glycosyltransferase [Candidatus Micrarchaeota archaeon]
MLSVIIPTHNEAKRIRPTLESLTRFLRARKTAFELVIVDDGSDSTSEIVRKFGEENSWLKLNLMHFPKRLGKGGGVKKGLEAARGEALLVYDADAATPPSEISKALEALKENDVVIGSRCAPGAVVQGVSPHRGLSSRVFNLLVRLLFGLRFSDTQCGFKAFRKKAGKALAGEITHSGYEFDVELLYRAKKKGFSIKEIPIRWKHVPGGPLEAGFFGVFKTALKMVLGLLKLRFELR